MVSYLSQGGQAKELDMQEGMHIDIGQELARIKGTLHEAQRRIMFRAEVATVKNCRKLVSANSSYHLSMPSTDLEQYNPRDNNVVGFLLLSVPVPS